MFKLFYPPELDPTLIKGLLEGLIEEAGET